MYEAASKLSYADDEQRLWRNPHSRSPRTTAGVWLSNGPFRFGRRRLNCARAGRSTVTVESSRSHRRSAAAPARPAQAGLQFFSSFSVSASDCLVRDRIGRAQSVAREFCRQPPGCFDSIALRDNTRLEVARSCKKGSTTGRIVLHRNPQEHGNERCCSPARGQPPPPDMLPLPVPRQIKR